ATDSTSFFARARTSSSRCWRRLRSIRAPRCDASVVPGSVFEIVEAGVVRVRLVVLRHEPQLCESARDARHRTEIARFRPGTERGPARRAQADARLRRDALRDAVAERGLLRERVRDQREPLCARCGAGVPVAKRMPLVAEEARRVVLDRVMTPPRLDVVA